MVQETAFAAGSSTLTVDIGAMVMHEQSQKYSNFAAASSLGENSVKILSGGQQKCPPKGKKQDATIWGLASLT